MIKTTAAGLSGNRKQNASRPWISAILVAFVVLLPAGAVSAESHKVRVKDLVLAQELLQSGGKLMADYGSFQLIETPEVVPADKQREQAQSEDNTDSIELNSIQINTRSSEGKALRKTLGAFAGKKLHLIQFVGPIKPEWREAVAQLGIQIVHYIPHNAYLIYGDANALARLQSWSGTINVVQWEGEFANAYKLQPGARDRDEFGHVQQLDTDTFAIQLLDDADANSTTLTLIESLKLAPVQREFQVLQYRNLIVRLPAGRLAEIAAQPDVVSIQPYTEPEKHDERQAQIIAGNVVGTSLTGPGYLAWLTEKGFLQSQFDASGFVVDVTDSGIDNGTPTPGHFGLYVNGNPALSSRVVYNRIEGTPHAGSTTAGCDGHGNLNAHILAGFNDYNGGFPHADSAGYRYGLGVCPFVRVGSSVVFDPDLFTSPNYANLQSKAYESGARISVNSWGVTNNTYTVDAQAFDALVRDAQPSGATFAAPGNQEMVIVFAAGNRGAAGNTLGAPGTAKNVITVGASENVRSLNTSNGGKSSMGNDGCGYTDAIADAANDMATFSSRGPCSDGRQKPDLVAPGSHITGGVPQSIATISGLGAALSCFKGSSICGLSGSGVVGSTNNYFPTGQQFYTVSSGTSQSAPAAAGACALLRQFFLNQNLAAPSPAMTKAFLMNSTRFLTGSGANDSLWSPGQGMGALNLGRALDGVARVLRDQVEPDIFTASGQTRVFTGRIAQTNQPLRVTLAWTDAPGSTTGNAFNNDLDLAVTVGGNTYKGNRFNGATSVTGGSADSKNNVESVFIPAGVSGDIVVSVTAANINSDGVPNYGSSLDQDFALVVYNATNTTVPLISPAGVTVSAEGFFPANGAVDPGETVAVTIALQNTGTAVASNLIVTLLATNGALSPSAPQSYGDLLNDGELVGRTFTFIASGSCGEAITPLIQVQEASGNISTLMLDIPLGLRTVQTQSFTNNTSLVIPDSGKASVYPSLLVVSGAVGTVQKVTATLRGYSHSWPDDVDVLLVGPSGQKVMLMADVGGGNARNAITVTFDDAATTTMSDSGAITASTYKPTNIDTTTDNFPLPAPVAPFGTTLSGFSGSDPNGTWSLYIQDDGALDSGSVTQGWVLSITTSNLTCSSGTMNLADLGVSIFNATNTIMMGSNFNLTITVTNRGPDPAAFVGLTNLLPAGLVYDAVVATQGNYSQTNGTGLWSLGMLNVGATASLSITARTLFLGEFTNVCQINSINSDTSPFDNIATGSIRSLKPLDSNPTVFTNVAPVLAAIANRTVHAGALVVISNFATDVDAPSGTVAFSLLPGAVNGATVDVATGLFTWQTTDAEANSTNQFSVQVIDNGLPPLQDVKSFAINVVIRPLIMGISASNGVVQVAWTSLPGQAYRLQCATNLVGENWSAISNDILATGDVMTYAEAIGADSQRFYRVLVLP